MPKKEEMYFRNIDANICHPLDYFLAEAKEEGLQKITLVRAKKDTETKKFVWCTEHGDVAEKKYCNKTDCPEYSSTSGRGVCRHRGKLYMHGEEVSVNVEEGKFGYVIGWDSLENSGLDKKLKKWD